MNPIQLTVGLILIFPVVWLLLFSFISSWIKSFKKKELDDKDFGVAALMSFLLILFFIGICLLFTL